MKKKYIIISVIAVVISIIIGVILGIFIKNNKVTRNINKIFYIVPKEPSIEKLAEDFKKKGIIRNEKFFVYVAKTKNLKDSIKNTNIIIKPGTSIQELIDKVKSDKPDFAIVTIPEGYTLYQIGERLEKNNLADRNSFVKLGLKDIKAETLISERKNVINELEGFLFPDTYYIPTDFNEVEIASLMFDRFKSIYSQKFRDRAKELGVSINDVITIASLIEREAKNDSERSKIAGVIYNRIKNDMLLQIDASVIYSHTKGEKHLSKLLYSDLKIDSKYNTYLYKGIPPGPIAAPGKPSIEAALYPESNDYLYYVASEAGHVFSKTYEEHLANVKKYIK